MNNDNQHIPSGYKPSPLGIIPEDWEVKRLGEVCTFHNGRAYSQKELLSSGKYRVLRVGNFFTNSSWYWSDMELEDDKYANDGDLLYAWSASFGPRFWEGERVIYHYHIWKIDSFNKISKDFLYSFLLYDATKLTNTLQGGTMTHVTKENMEKRSIAIPPLPEQQRIVSLLSLWDTAIAIQTTLIEQLTLRKRGLMQQLLTGKKRLKGFEGEWKEVRMQDLASFAGGGTPSTKRSDFWEGTIPWISSSDLVEDCLTNNESRYITEEAIANSTTQLLPSKSILIVTRVGVGKVAIAEHPICVSQDFTCLTKYDADTLFLAYSLLLTMKKKKSQSQGTSIKGVSTDEISKIKLLLPSIEEQKAIASVLINADKEIEIQKQKLAAMQEQKKGLMQVLLTGKKRIINKI
jgi:type I restriction enzyme S subunit